MIRWHGQVERPPASHAAAILDVVTSPLRILIAEDDALIGMLLADLLTTMGHEVCAVEDTEADAVSSAALHRPDLIIADGWLRVGSGVAAVQKILRTQIIAYIFVTGDYASIEMRMPGVVVLNKPFNEITLEHAIARVFPQDLPRSTDKAALPL